MNAELEQTWRDLVADAAEQKRRAELFPELVDALDIALTYVTTWATWCQQINKQVAPSAVHQTTIDRTTALLIRCRTKATKPTKPQP